MTAPYLEWPCDTHTVTCGFFCYPYHFADDLAASFEEARACAPGKVITADQNVVFCEREGRYIEILHDGGWLSRYFHLSNIAVSVGQIVAAGQRIGVSGSTGYYVRDGKCVPYAPHLHWALWAPTYEEALAVWGSPGAVANGRWAVDPVWVITHQEEEVKTKIVKCDDGFHYAVRSDGTRVLLGVVSSAQEPKPRPTVAASAAAAKLLVDLGLAESWPSIVTGTDLYPVPSFEDIT